LKRSLGACAVAVVLLLSACGGSSASSDRNIGKAVKREFQAALTRTGGTGRRPSDFAVDRCVGQQLGIPLSQATVQDVLDVQQSSNTLLFDCTVTQTAASQAGARWVYLLDVSATGKWQASLHSAARGPNNSASCAGGICTGPRGLTPPLSLVAHRSPTATPGLNAAASHATRPAGSPPKWGKGLIAMSTNAGARALSQAQIPDSSCLAVAVVNGYASYAMVKSRRSSACEERRESAQKYVMQRHDGVWENLWEGVTGCPPALPGMVIETMFHVRVSSCEDS
jgi:hypothetical protein